MLSVPGLEVFAEQYPWILGARGRANCPTATIGEKHVEGDRQFVRRIVENANVGRGQMGGVE